MPATYGDMRSYRLRLYIRGTHHGGTKTDIFHAISDFFSSETGKLLYDSET